MYRRPGLFTITWGNWKIKWFVPFCLESVRKYRLSVETMQFLYSFWSVQLIQIYFVVGYSSTRSTTNLILWENKHLKAFIHEIFNQTVSHVNVKHPRRAGELLCVLERWHTCYWLKQYLLQRDLKGCMATSHFLSIQWDNLEGESLEIDLYGTSFSCACEKLTTQITTNL